MKKVLIFCAIAMFMAACSSAPVIEEQQNDSVVTDSVEVVDTITCADTIAE